MLSVEENKKCSGCFACEEVCPIKCIEMLENEDGFLYPKIDKTKCINCKKCEKICPTLNVTQKENEEAIQAFAAINTLEDIRLQSSSGGLFYLFAGKILKDGGVVFGAAFDNNFEVAHTFVEDLNKLSIFQGSKYVQSKVGNAYTQVKKFLQDGRTVLFTGTPCQIGGLLAFLERPYDNLITQDIICHGVPSPKVWRQYIRHRKSKANGSDIEKISFREKSGGWKKFSVVFSFYNDTEYRCVLHKDPWMQIFLKNLCLRPSCYDCAFKTKKRQADITLADFWGIQNILPEMDDDKGTSLLILHTKKAKRLFEEINERVRYAEVSLEQALKYNSSMISSVKMPKQRKKFLNGINEHNFEKYSKKFCRPTLRIFLSRIKGRIAQKLKALTNKKN